VVAAQGPAATLLTRARDAVCGSPARSIADGGGKDTSWRESVAAPANDRTMSSRNLVKPRFVATTRAQSFRGHATVPRPASGTDVARHVWSLVGNELVEQKRFDTVVSSPSPVSDPHRPMGARRQTARASAAGHAPSAPGSRSPMFHPAGRVRPIFGTTGEDYLARFDAVITALRQNGIDAPIFVAIESGYCDGAGTPPAPDTRSPSPEAAHRRA